MFECFKVGSVSSDLSAAFPEASPELRFRATVRRLLFQLLQLAVPDSLPSCDKIPESFRREYLLSQEHFSVAAVVRHLCANVELQPALARKWVWNFSWERSVFSLV
jgi:hypothetical protein